MPRPIRLKRAFLAGFWRQATEVSRSSMAHEGREATILAPKVKLTGKFETPRGCP